MIKVCLMLQARYLSVSMGSRLSNLATSVFRTGMLFSSAMTLVGSEPDVAPSRASRTLAILSAGIEESRQTSIVSEKEKGVYGNTERPTLSEWPVKARHNFTHHKILAVTSHGGLVLARIWQGATP